MNKMILYNKSPIFLQNMMTTAQGMLYNRERYGKYYKSALKSYCQRDYSDYDRLVEYQWKRAAELIRYAVAKSAFYKDFYADYDIEEVIRKQDITLLPILEKETVRKNIHQLYTLDEKDAFISNTSGTTGTSMQFRWRKDDLQKRMAYLDAFKIRNGFVPMKMKRASFSSAKVVPPDSKKKIFWRDNLSIRQRIYSGYHCKGDNLQYYVENLNKYKPESLDGYPSAMYEIAHYILVNKINLSFTPIAIFPTAETLLPHYRDAIEKAFKCPVRDQYASSEGAPFINEFDDGKLHYCMDTGIIEFQEDGRMLVTCFETHGTPLIRYDIGDRAFLSLEKSSGRNAMPIVDRIEGRTADYIESPKNGRFTSIYLSLVSGEFMNCMKAMQFVQNENNSVDVYLETDDNYDKSMNKIIEDKLHYSMGNEMIIRVHHVDTIKKDKSGKFRFIIRNI